MDIVIDIGNTNSKLGVFENNSLQVVHKFSHFPDLVNYLSNASSIDRVIFVNVSKHTFTQTMLPSIPMIEFSSKTPIPIINSYETPNTLGYDRIAALMGVYSQIQSTSKLVIDLGTCMTYDLLTSQNIYIGGGIALGLRSRLRQLYEVTGGLPLVAPYPIEERFVRNTKDGIMSGTFLGMQAEIQDIICQAEQEFAPLEIFLCGGEADLFVNRFAQKVKLKPHLILKGLYRILNYQRNKSYLETVIGIPKIQS